MKNKFVFAVQTAASLLFIAALILIKDGMAHMIISIAYVLYLVAAAFVMIKKCDVLVRLLDEIGTWQTVAEKIAAENPKECWAVSPPKSISTPFMRIWKTCTGISARAR